MLLSTSPWELSEENNFEKFLQLFWTFFQMISGNWAGKVWPACQNCILRIYKIILKKLFWKTNEIFHHFQTLSWKFPASFRVYRRGCWNWILRVQGNILAKDSFISTFFHFWTLSDFCDQFSQKKERCCQNWTLSFNGDFRVQVSCKIYKLLFSWISSKKISAGFPKKVSGAFKLLSTSPWDNLKKIFYWKVFASFLDFFSDQFQ